MSDAELTPAMETHLAPRDVRTVHVAVMEQITEDLGVVKQYGEPVARVDLLRSLVDDLTFSVALHWLSTGRRSSLDTKRGYADDLIKVAEWACAHFGERPIALLHRLDHFTVTTWTIYAKSQKRWAVRTQRRILSAVSSLFTYAAKHGVPVSNPVDFEEHAQQVGTSSNGRPVDATRVLAFSELAAIEAAAATPEDNLVFDLAVLQGLRESEIVKINVENIDRDASPYRLKLERKRGKWITRELPPRTEQYLETHLDGRDDGPLLLDPKTGQRRNRHQVIDITRRLARAAKVPNPNKVTPHVLRASAITDLLESGKPLQEVQKWAGHSDPSTTQGYWERRNEVKRDAALTSALIADLAEAAAHNL
ncbi:site-specific integrase [Amycolatopsis sp. NPDC023774]|uniref:tyrosine-type recombinase/integrase n=1 Tax=Amycolatopsis sp. NPDC023774 TaxID=3155015 RepID=UPI0033F8AC4E